MARPRFEFSLQALLDLRQADKRELELRIVRLQDKLRRARANHARRLERVAEGEQAVRDGIQALAAPQGVKVQGADVRRQAHALADRRAELERRRRRAVQKQATVRLFQGQLQALEVRRKEIQAEIDELERVKGEERLRFRRDQERREERDRDEDQILRGNREE